MALRVKMNPIKEVLNGVSQTTGMKIALTTLTAGPTKATTSPQDAQIEFYEMDAKSGESKGQRLFATLKFKLSLSASGQPKLDGENKTPSSLVYETFLRSDHVKHPTGYFPPDRSGDFFLDLELPDQADNFFNVSRLYIPWEVESDHVAEIGARLLVAGSEEASPLANGIFTVPLDHKNVPENGKSGGLKIDHVGVGVVYPTDSSLWAPGVYGGAKKASKAPASAFNIYLHDQILDEFSKPPNRKVVLADVEARLIDVFSDTDLPKPTIALKTDADLKAKGFERRVTARGTAWTANASLLAKPDEWLPSEGVSMSLFDFWVVFEPTLKPQTVTEDGETEAIADFNPSSSPPTKLVTWPISMLKPSLSKTVGMEIHPKLGQAYYPSAFIANVISHEIGHALGLRHALRSDSTASTGYALSRKDKAKESLARGVMAYINIVDFVSFLGFFGPVHRSTIKARFK